MRPVLLLPSFYVGENRVYRELSNLSSHTACKWKNSSLNLCLSLWKALVSTMIYSLDTFFKKKNNFDIIHPWLHYIKEDILVGTSFMESGWNLIQISKNTWEELLMGNGVVEWQVPQVFIQGWGTKTWLTLALTISSLFLLVSKLRLL